MKPKNEDICLDCKHEYAVHGFTNKGLEICAQGTQHTLPGGNQFDYDSYIAKCLCEGFAVRLAQR